MLHYSSDFNFGFQFNASVFGEKSNKIPICQIFNYNMTL